MSALKLIASFTLTGDAVNPVLSDVFPAASAVAVVRNGVGNYTVQTVAIPAVGSKVSITGAAVAGVGGGLGALNHVDDTHKTILATILGGAVLSDAVSLSVMIWAAV